MERALTALLRADPSRPRTTSAGHARRPAPRPTTRRCCAAGPSWACRSTPRPGPGRRRDGDRPPPQVALRLRRARSVRISIDGNAHFCRGLLATRYPGAEDDQARARRATTSHTPAPLPGGPELMRAVRVPGTTAAGDGRRPEAGGRPARSTSSCRIGGAGVCRTDLHILEGQWAAKSRVAAAVHDRARERRLGRRGRQAVTNVAVGDKVILHPLVTCGLCRACRAGDDVHCENGVPRHRHRRRVCRVPADLRPQLREDRRLAGAGRRRRAGRRRAHRVPRGGQGGGAAAARRPPAWSSAPAGSGTSASR